MIRKQVLIREDQNTRLKAAADRMGVSEADLIRKGIDHVLAEREAADDDWRRAILGAAGIWAERDDVDALIADLRSGWDRRLNEIFEQWRGGGRADDAA